MSVLCRPGWPSPSSCCTCPDKNEDILETPVVSPFSYQTTEPTDPSGLKCPQESHTGRRRTLNPGDNGGGVGWGGEDLSLQF